MKIKFANRMTTVHRSFIREILRVTESPDVISFAGGLPKPDLFPVQDLNDTIEQVLAHNGSDCLQYSSTEGYFPLRQLIADRYAAKSGLTMAPDNILITSGSQQGLDLVGKVLLDAGDEILVERPSYLGALQAFSFYQPGFRAVDLAGDGPDPAQVEDVMKDGAVKLYYAVPNFQNPSGQSYSMEKRQAVARLCRDHGVLFVEDDPYGELRYRGDHLPPVYSLLEGKSILMGSFSKIGVPGFRLGWVVASDEVMEKLVIAKQAADLHTSTFIQYVACQYMAGTDLEGHIGQLRKQYGFQMETMLKALEDHLPDEAGFTPPDGGMFIWVTLPEGFSSMELFEAAMKRKVAFVPGRPFFVDGSGDECLRLNFSNADPDTIVEGIRRLGECIEEMLS